MRDHPTNPHGVLVPCATCGREIHAPRDDFTKGGIDPANLTCSFDCMTANQAKQAAAVIPELDDLTDEFFDSLRQAGVEEHRIDAMKKTRELARARAAGARDREAAIAHHGHVLRDRTDKDGRPI